ncbi:MAG: hypothetical protein JNM56_13320 [Planctomycetia bacterium]|nr:hypothetical protein [Planctomycetia bacterium]
MRFNGEWLLCADGLLRPVILGEVHCGDAVWTAVKFQIDTGADRTVFNAATLALLCQEQMQPTEMLGGVGGPVNSILIDSRIRLSAADGKSLTINARFAAFTDPEALDMSVLGRDITNLFALIVDRPGDVDCLLSQQHRYVIQTA